MAFEIPLAAILPQPFFLGSDPAGANARRSGAEAVAFAHARIDGEALAAMSAAPGLFWTMIFHRPWPPDRIATVPGFSVFPSIDGTMYGQTHPVAGLSG
jgi:hypothetical protein